MSKKVVSEVEIECTVNGASVTETVRPNQTLVDFIRDELSLTGTTEGCGVGVCGCCTVFLDDEPINSCLELAVNADGVEITTIEGLGGDGELHPVQDAFREEEGFQCGYCTPGMIMMTDAMLREHPDADDHRVEEYMSENLCRCTGYGSILDAIDAAKAKRPD